MKMSHAKQEYLNARTDAEVLFATAVNCWAKINKAIYVDARGYLRLFGSTPQRLGWFGKRWQQCRYHHPLLGDGTATAGVALVDVPRPLVHLARAVMPGEYQRR